MRNTDHLTTQKIELGTLAVIDTAALIFTFHAWNLDDPAIITPLFIGTACMLSHTLIQSLFHMISVDTHTKSFLALHLISLLGSALMILGAGFGLASEIDDSFFSIAWGGLLGASTLTFGWNTYKLCTTKDDNPDITPPQNIPLQPLI